MKRFYLTFFSVIVSVLLLISTASASPVYYTDSTAWNTAATGITTEDYELYDWTNSNGDFLGSSTTLGEISYNTTQFIYGVSPNVTNDAEYHTGNYLEWQSSKEDLVILLPAVTNAIAFDFGGYFERTLDLTVTLGTGVSTVVSSQLANSDSFFGVVSDLEFDTFTLKSSYRWTTVDNLSYATVSAPVPEPSTMLLLGSGLVGLAWCRPKRKKA